MVATEEKVGAVERIGKIEFTVKQLDGESEHRTARQERIDALANLLLAQWRLEHGEAFN